MEKEKQEWFTQTAKYKELVHTEEYTPNAGKNTHHYTILEHEYIVLFEKTSGEYKIIKHDLNLITK